jgi:hypothetical protein
MIKLEDKIMTKRIYNQPQVQVAHLASMTLMQAASPAGSSSGPEVYTGIETNDQW